MYHPPSITIYEASLLISGQNWKYSQCSWRRIGKEFAKSFKPEKIRISTRKINRSFHFAQSHNSWPHRNCDVSLFQSWLSFKIAFWRDFFFKLFFSNFSFLCANFANTMAIKDRMGRTPFHYSAICNDGGQYYDLLKQHGADSSLVDSVIEHFIKSWVGLLFRFSVEL